MNVVLTFIADATTAATADDAVSTATSAVFSIATALAAAATVAGGRSELCKNE